MEPAESPSPVQPAKKQKTVGSDSTPAFTFDPNLDFKTWKFTPTAAPEEDEEPEAPSTSWTVAESAPVEPTTTAEETEANQKLKDVGWIADKAVVDNMKDNTAVASGEEDDTVVGEYSVDLYRLREASEASDRAEFFLAGKGILRFNVYKSSDGECKARLVMRDAQTRKSLLNLPVFPEMVFADTAKHHLKSVPFAGFVDGSTLVQFLAKFESAEERTAATTCFLKLQSKIKKD